MNRKPLVMLALSAGLFALYFLSTRQASAATLDGGASSSSNGEGGATGAVPFNDVAGSAFAPIPLGLPGLSPGSGPSGSLQPVGKSAPATSPSSPAAPAAPATPAIIPSPIPLRLPSSSQRASVRKGDPIRQLV